MSEKKQEVIRSTDPNGNEILSYVEDGKDTGIILTMEQIYETRDVVAAQEENIRLAKQSLTENPQPDKKQKRNRLVHYNAHFKNNATGDEYTLKQGGMPTMEDRIKWDMTGTMVMLSKIGGDEVINLIVPFKKDGTIPESFPYEVTMLPEILTFGAKDDK